MTATLWIDVEDLFCYARVNARPSGIQRVAFEISRTLQQRYGDSGRVRFVRYESMRDSFRVVEWPEFVEMFDGLTESEPLAERHAPAAVTSHPPSRQFVRKWVHRLPELLRGSVTELLLTHERVFLAWAGLFGALARGAVGLLRGGDARSQTQEPRAPSPNMAFATQAAPGDTLLALGAPWSHPDYAGLIQRHRKRHGLRYALVVYDIIPLRRPEWCERGLVRLFRTFCDDVLPLCDTILAISQATAADVSAYMRERGMTAAGPVVPIPMGSGFGEAPPVTLVPRTDRLPPAGSYALFVSTIEARKNHLLMFRVWRRLLEELPPDRVPTLVFAGRVGWLVDDLMRQIANADHLDGKLVIIEDPNDVELAALYQGCLFTVFPSLYEGWGLPVTESLSFGKPCLIADRTSLPEAGGDLVRRFDPDNLNDAFAVIRDVIQDPVGLRRWEEQVRREFRPVSWTVTTEALITALGFAETPDEATERPQTARALTEPGAVF